MIYIITILLHIDCRIPVEVRHRLEAYQTNKINKEGELVITSQENRTQSKNKEDCLNKLREMIAEAYISPKEREMWEGLSEKGKVMVIEHETMKSLIY